MVFILYKLYVLLPYTYPTPKLSPHRRRCISTFPQKNSLCMIYKRFELWGHWKCPHKSPSSFNTCHTHVIIHICVLINHINMHTHTHTHTHVYIYICGCVCVCVCVRVCVCEKYLLQSSVSHDSSKIMLIYWFAAQETFYINKVENCCAA